MALRTLEFIDLFENFNKKKLDVENDLKDKKIKKENNT